jgi:amino acid adenylation domain-containing protein
MRRSGSLEIDVSPIGKAGVDISANAVSPDKLLEKMLGGASEPAAPFGLIRDKPCAVKRAILELDRDLANRLREQAARLDVSLESLVYLTWSLILARFCGQERVTFGAALPPLTKVFPVRIDAAASPVETAVPEIHELLTQIRAFLPAWGALLPDDPGAEYTLPALFGYGLPEDHVWAGELSGGAWPLAVIAAERGETLLISAWAQNPADPATVCAYMRTALERLAGTLETVPDTLAASIDVMPEEERRRVLYEWNDTARGYPRDTCIHELFEAQVLMTPDAVAVCFEDRTLTYAELNARANQLARYLRRPGVRPDDRVAICVERCLEMVIAILAVLKAGGAYVPLDPAYPAERLAHMLEDSTPVVLLTNGPAHAAIDGFWEMPRVIDIVRDAAHWAGESDANQDSRELGIGTHHLAYIIYTSGSTGIPKGAMIKHANVTRLFGATDAWFNFDANDVWSLFHSFAFDFSVWEIWGALLYGGKLVVIPLATARSSSDFYDMLCETGVTVLNQTPSAFRALMAAQALSEKKHQLRYVIFGGEALDVPSLKPWFARNQGQDLKLINMYGITETTVHVTYRPISVTDTDTAKPGASPVGRRIPDLKTYILDAHQNPVPVGVTGATWAGPAWGVAT